MGQLPALDPPLVARLFAESRASDWRLSPELFRAALEAGVARAFADRNPNSQEVERHVRALHINDLALAAACAAGHEPAWDHFVREFRPALYRAADAIDPSGGARDLADALYGDLFGVKERQGVRQSLFRYFHGRSSLSTWLRAVLAQRHIDRLRAGRRLEPLPDDESMMIDGSSADVPDLERATHVGLMREALRTAIAGLAPRDRLRLSCYYAQDMTLAAIGRMLKEHEGTVSRHLTRTRRLIREGVEARLREDQGFDDAALAECVESVVADAGSMDLAELIDDRLAPGPSGKNAGVDRSRWEGDRRGQ